MIIGDVRGKGLDAVGDAALVLGAFRAAAHQEGALAGLAAYLETAVTPALEYPDGSRPGPGDAGESFVTATVLDIPDHESVLHLVTCGHPPPLLVRGGRVASLDVAHPAPPLGLGSLADARPVAEVFAFAPGDIVLLYTDGVLEARDDAGVFYPLAERVGRWDGAGPHHLLARLHDDLITHAAGGTLGDDAAMVAIQRLPSAPVTSGPPLTGR
ncbi:PP2C family protein-serine/threonine phosphatase [Streptomyces sp. 12297]